MCVSQGQQETLVQITHSVPLLLRNGVPANATLSISSERGSDHYNRVLSCSLDSKQVWGSSVKLRILVLALIEYGGAHTAISCKYGKSKQCSIVSGYFCYKWFQCAEHSVTCSYRLVSSFGTEAECTFTLEPRET